MDSLSKLQNLPRMQLGRAYVMAGLSSYEYALPCVFPNVRDMAGTSSDPGAAIVLSLTTQGCHGAALSEEPRRNHPEYIFTAGAHTHRSTHRLALIQ